MKNAWLKLIAWMPVAVVWWAVQMSIKAVVALLGLFVVPFMYRYRNTKLMWVPWYFRPWLNPEDWTGGTQNNVGSIPDWWRKRMGDGKWSFYKYHAIRNPADGLRNFKWLNCQIEPDKICVVCVVIEQARKVIPVCLEDARTGGSIVHQPLRRVRVQVIRLG